MNQFYKGRTNNHLTWVMVDATDFATPESALSAAMTIKIYGKLRGATGVNFVSSGTGSLTNDIQHVGASATGVYTIALAKADLSDASAAWYDQYTVILAGTGAAQQVLVVDGGIDNSTILVLSDAVSNVMSQVLLATSAASDAASAAQQANSRVLVIQSQASDAYSAIIAPLASMTSDVASAVWAHAIGTRVDSRVLLNQSRISDIYSLLSDVQSDFQSRVPKLVATNSQVSDLASDIKSAVAGITVTISASDVSDIASAVVAALPITSSVSDIYSMLSDLLSDFQSRVPKRVATDSQLSDLHSDLRSYLVGVSGVASDAHSAATAAASRATLLLSNVSDVQSAVTLVLSLASDAHSAAVQANSGVLLVQSRLSDLDSRLVSDVSDIYSLLSDHHSTMGSQFLVLSNFGSYLSGVVSGLGAGQSTSAIADKVWSDYGSKVGASASQVYSDLLSAVHNVPSDTLSAAVVAPLDVNLKKINGTTVIGNGAGTPWGP